MGEIVVNFRSLMLFMLSFSCLVIISSCLLPTGKNVKTSYRYFYVQEKTSARERTSRQTCTYTSTGWFGWSRRRVCRTIFYYVWKTAYKNVKKSEPVYTCKQGWEAENKDSSGCTIPICTGGCQNGGVCTNPNTCSCTAGWTGSRCRTDVNECKTNLNKCVYKPGCRNTPGSFRCICRLGYYLNMDQRSCSDIDECSTGQYTCGPNSSCLNNPGSYSCPCNSGFQLNQSTNLCEDVDECSPSSGIVHGCEMKCNNFAGSYNCSCDKGYYLASNGRDCADHDECKKNTHGCQHECLNQPGGFICSCYNGYRVNASNLKRCDDIDECSDGVSGCDHTCTNAIGSFTCSCKKGYLLEDARSCRDIDECSMPVDHCQHNCINTAGSYRCTCRIGFDLHLDGKTCRGRPCFPIYNLINGMQNCSGYRTEDTCSFECLPGYELTGSSTRTCMSNKQWTGNNTECKIIHCEKPEDPSNGFIYSPCLTHYGSKCSVGCDNGYFTKKNIINCDANGSWLQTNVSCKEIKVCQPNPCQRGGLCSVVNKAQYTCDCTNTGYMGTKCDVGFFTIPEYPRIQRHVMSPPITIKASPPSDYVVLSFINRNLKFSPTMLFFKRGTSLSQSIKISAAFTGHYFIRYALSGPNAADFYLPEKDILFVNAGDSSTEDLPTDFPKGCYRQQIKSCPHSKKPIIASSTSHFKSFGPLIATQGVVALEIDNSVNIPLSTVGLNLPNTNINLLPDTCKERNDVSFSTESLLKSRVLAESFIDIVTEGFPSWLNITLDTQHFLKKTYASELRTYFLTGDDFRKNDVGKSLPLVGDSFYSLLKTKNLNVTIANDVDVFHSSDLSLAVELCETPPLTVFMRPSLQKDINPGLRNLSFLQEMKDYGWNVVFHAFQISKKNIITRSSKGPFWNGSKFFFVNASSDGSFAGVSSLNKYFRNSTFADIRLKFEGTIIGKVKDMDQILHYPLKQNWNVDLYGETMLTLNFSTEGESAKLSLSGRQSVSYASFGGFVENEVPENKDGLFFTSILEKDPFLDTVLREFVEMSSEKNISCFLNTRLYKERDNVNHTEMTDAFSCTFRGGLKFGALRFKPVHVNLLMGKDIPRRTADASSNNSIKNNVMLTGKDETLDNRTFGVFKHSPDNPLNTEIFVAQNSLGSTGSFRTMCSILGIEKLVNITVNHNGLRFRVGGKLHGMYDANMTCSSRLLPWENQVFQVEGTFLAKSEGLADLVSHLNNKVDTYAVDIVKKSEKRLQEAKQTAQRANSRLAKVLSLRSEAEQNLNEIEDEFFKVAKSFETAQHSLSLLKIKAGNYSEFVEKIESDLNSLCKVKDCPQVCQEGIFCTTCYQDITSKTMGMCSGTCFRTEQRLIPPTSVLVFCEREKCKRIHRTNGFFKSFFGGLLGGIVKEVFSFVISGVATVLGAPPPLASALGGGITTFLDTGRVDETLCSFNKGLITGSIKGPGSLVVGKAIRCQRKQQDASWKCSIVEVQCKKGRYEYEYEQIPYSCKKSCLVESVTKSIEKSCCKNVSCALLVVNVSCIAANVFCKNARLHALKTLSDTKSQAVKLLQSLESARKNVSYWKMKKQRVYTKLISARRWFNRTDKAVRSQEKAYNGTINSIKVIEKLLTMSLEVKKLLNKQMTFVEGMKIKEIGFQAKVFAGSSNLLLPIDITILANNTLKYLPTVLDFENVNVSLMSIAEEILKSVVENTHRSLRKRRSADILTSESDKFVSKLKKYHSYCAKFTNYHELLFELASSLYNLSSEAVNFTKTSSIDEDSFLNVSYLLSSHSFKLNQTFPTNVDINYDTELSEALFLQQEATEQRYEALNSSSILLVYNWYATMEETFNSSRLIHYDCTGINDCMLHILEILDEMFSSVESDKADLVQKEIKNLEIAIDDLLNPVDLTIDKAVNISSRMLDILSKIALPNVLCAHPPNITTHPFSFIEIGSGSVLELYCNATGTALFYSWIFNDEIIQDQNSNILIINNTTTSNSGNYTCQVSNHIGIERSTPGLVNVHPPPIITVQPIAYLAVILSEDEYLNCEVEDNGLNITYQWWFKSVNSSFSFEPLYNETFSYLSFTPMKKEHEGWYFCKISNRYGVTSSRVSFVKALSFTLPVPTVLLTFSVIRHREQSNSTTGYDKVKSRILIMLSSFQGFIDEEKSIQNLRPISCELEESKTNTSGIVEVCSWEFRYIGRNCTSNVTVNNDFEMNAQQVINATKEVKERVKVLVNATNNGSVLLTLPGEEYLVEKNSIGVQKFSLTCPETQVLFQEDFKCIDCPPGYYAEVDSCKACPLGFYQTESGKTSCEACLKGFTTENEGSYNNDQCRVICKSGHYAVVIDDIGYCPPCPVNQYQPLEGQTECIQCPYNHVTNREGTSDRSQCVLLKTTEFPNKTAATDAPIVPTYSTTPQVNYTKDHDELNKIFVIGVPIIVLFLLISIGVGILIWRTRKVNRAKTKQNKEESNIGHSNPVFSSTINEESCFSKTESSSQNHHDWKELKITQVHATKTEAVLSCQNQLFRELNYK